MKPYVTLILLLALALRAFGTTFTVISNADSGPGTFRDALQQASANGSVSPDQIVFNLPDLTTTGRTITLLSALPDLSSNLTIDGTTQPGTPFGISNARVIIRNDPTQMNFSFFQAIGQNNISVYGLYLQGVNGAVNCFHFQQASYFQFGAPGKGNVIDGFQGAFTFDQLLFGDPGSTNITIQSNILGIDTTGLGMNSGTNYYSFFFASVANLQIGGLNPGEGNLMAEAGYPMGYSTNSLDNFGYLNIQGNIQGTDITGNKRLSPGHSWFTIYGFAGGYTLDGNINVNITNNISVGGFSFENIGTPIVIQGNHLGVGADNTTNIIAGSTAGNVVMLSFQACNQVLIGGPNPNDGNYIAYGSLYGISEFDCINITISRNSIFCNGTGGGAGNNAGINITWALPQRPEPFVNITTLTTGLVGGTALPNSTIELFYDDQCPGCEGKTYIGTTTADNNGNWSYALAATGAIVATATDIFGATSPFSTATINTDSVVVRNATCGHTNGSIKNIKVSSGTEWYWEDANGNIVSTSTDLTNVGPGTYTFMASIGGASCNAMSSPYTITNVNPPIVNSGDIAATQPTCGQANGAFRDLGTFDTIATYVWLKGGAEVCPDFDTINPFYSLAPGLYILQVALKQDQNCFMQYGPYVLTNQSGPTLDTSQVTITPATCGLANGSIADITYQNATGMVNLYWEDSTGLQLSYIANLTNVIGGPYRLTISDQSGCTPLVTSWYRIPNLGSITSDTSKMVITPGSCGQPNGAITGIIATNATTFNWTTAAGQTLPANTLDISGLAPGTYLLSLTNAYGCQAATQPIVVPQIPNPAFDYSRLLTVNDTCNSGTGAILDLAMIDPARGYTWAWFEGSQSDGTTPGHLDSLKAGTYGVTVSDTYNCTVTSNPFTIQDIEYTPDAPQVTDQFIPRNTSATIVVTNPHKGTYELLAAGTTGATVLATSTDGILQTPPVPQDETLYVLFIRGDCSSTPSPVNIKVFDSVMLYVPNAFSPNGASNNRWRVIAEGLVKNIHISVYDRYGQQIFAASNIADSWDGTTAGHPSSGTFVYLITGTDYFNHPFRLSGTVMVIR